MMTSRSVAGFIQTYNWTEDLHSHGKGRDVLEVDVPLGHSVMLSVAQRDTENSESFSYFEKANGNYHKTVRIDGPTVIMTEQFRVVCKLGTLGTFRVLFTFHNVWDLEYYMLCLWIVDQS